MTNTLSLNWVVYIWEAVKTNATVWLGFDARLTQDASRLCAALVIFTEPANMFLSICLRQQVGIKRRLKAAMLKRNIVTESALKKDMA